MKNVKPDTTTKDSNPEALAKFAQTARMKDGKANRTGMTAKPETAAIESDPELEHEAAERVLREGATKRDENSEALIKKLPDRILDHHK